MISSCTSGDLDRTLSFISELQKINNLVELTCAIQNATSHLGVEKLLAGFMPSPGMLASQQIKHILFAKWPEEWSQQYFANGLLFQDPTIKRVRRSDHAFIWSNLTPNISKKELYVMDMAKEHHLHNGFTVPMISLDGKPVGVSFAGKNIDDSPQSTATLNLIANFAFGRALEINNNRSKTAARLTPREHETLQWVAAGKTEWETSVILNVSQKAIAKHIYNVRIKLGAVNRTHAVAIALRDSLIK